MSAENLLNLGYNVDLYLKRGDPRPEHLQTIRSWISKESLIPDSITDAQLVLFLLACRCDIESTKKCIYEYYSARFNAPELFNERDTARVDIQSQLKALEYVVLPVDTDDGYRIIAHRLKDTTPSSYHMDVAMKVYFMTIDAALYKGPPKGLIILFDMKGVRLTHLTRTKIGAVRKFCHYLQEALPVRLQVIHTLNVVSFFDKVMLILKPFLKKELLNMLKLHPSNMNMEEFYEKSIPRKCLPSDFGGDLPSLEELHARQCKEFETLIPYFTAEEKQRLGCQPTANGNNKNVNNGIHGCTDNFQKLELD